MTKDLTKGNIFHLLISFLLPVLTGQLLQQVYNLADTAIVGRTLGVLALGGVGSTGSLHFLIIGFADGVCTGFGLPISQAFGAGNARDKHRGAVLCLPDSSKRHKASHPGNELFKARPCCRRY